MKSPALLCVGLLFAWAPAAHAVDVVESQTLWGFDGQVQVERFAPLTIEVDNPSPEPVEVTLTLRKHLHQGAGGIVDVRLVERRVFLGPHQRRNVQFYPYVSSQYVKWTVSWSRRLSDRKELPAPRFTNERAAIVMTSGSSVETASVGLKQFPEDRFPPIATATETLAVVVLDHVPRWDEESRRQAFLQWLHLGGRLQLFHDSTGRFPEFSGSLGVLNSPLEVQRIGAGTVYRHPLGLGEVDAASMRKYIGEQEGNTSDVAEVTDENSAQENFPPMPPPVAAGPVAYGAYGEINHDNFNLDEEALRALKKLTSPDHNWALLHVMSWFYCASVVGWYVMAQRWDYRTMLVVFVLTVAAFSFSFAHVGRRGYGEVTASHSMALARPAGEGEWELLQWNNLFVTSGDIYRLSHHGTGGLYSTAQEAEEVNGEVDSGIKATFTVDIPPYSSRSFVSRAIVPGKPLDVSVEKFDRKVGIRSLALRVAGGLPEGVREIYAVAGSEYSKLTPKGDLLIATWSASISPLVQLQSSPDVDQPTLFSTSRSSSSGAKLDRETYFKYLLPAVIAESLGIDSEPARREFELPADRVRLLLYADMPEDFFVNTEFESERDGRVLFAVDALFAESP